MKNNEITLFIDLDGTVYNKYNGMWEEMSARIDRFMHSELGIPEEDILPTRDKYYAQYGSTLKGIQLNHEVDPLKYLAFVHDLDLTKYLAYDSDLRYNLKSIPYPKWIFTNSPRDHALRVLKMIGIDDLFEGILDVWAMHYIPKPERFTYFNALMLAGNPVPSTCIFVDDTAKNLAPARALGWQTVWIDQAESHPAATYTMPKLHYLPDVIFQVEDKMQMVKTPERKIQPLSIPVFTVD